MLDMSARQWKQDVLESAADRFERRLSEECGAVRLDVTREIAAVRLDIARTHNSTLRWTFVQWLTLMLALVAIALKVFPTLNVR